MSDHSVYNTAVKIKENVTPNNCVSFPPSPKTGIEIKEGKLLVCHSVFKKILVSIIILI